MSRSYRKTPIFGWSTARSESADKKIWHGRARARGRVALHADMESARPLDEREVSNVAAMSKDGKTWLRNPDAAVRLLARVRKIPLHRAKHKLFSK